MKLHTLLPLIQAQLLTVKSDVDVSGCYISDLLSDVLAYAQSNILWATIQTHRNVISVASMKDITAVLFTCGRKPEASIIAEAEEEGIVLVSTPLNTYQAAGKLWAAGLHD